MSELTACRKPDCLRKVKTSVAYCCAPCSTADERGYEIHESGPLGHTADCAARTMARGEWLWSEAEALRASLP